MTARGCKNCPAPAHISGSMWFCASWGPSP